VLANKINMYAARSIGIDHKDLIQDVAYDFHGKRMATCSCDQFVKVFIYFSMYIKRQICDTAKFSVHNSER
jgi:hypothetical protein